MKNRILHIVLLLMVTNGLFAEIPDTIRIEQVNVVEKYLPDHTGYMLTKIDSVALNVYKQDNLSTILSLQSPVFIKDYGPGNIATSSFRGANAAHTQVLWNGININSPMLGQSDFAQIPLQMIDEIIIYHGGASVAGNSGAIGGTVNIFNNPNWNNTTDIQLVEELGSFGKSHTYISGQFGNKKILSNTRLIYNRAKNNFTYKNIPFAYSDVFEQQHAAYLYQGIIEELYFRLSEKSQLSFLGWYQDNFNEIPSNANDEEQNSNSIKTVLGYKYYEANWILKANMGYVYDFMNYRKSLIQIDSKNEVNTYSSKVDFTYKLSSSQKLNFATSFQQHAVESNNYGTIHYREELDNTLSYSGDVKKLVNYHVGIKNQFIDLSAYRFIPSLGVDFKLSPSILLKTSYNQNYHFPTLNDLYWEFDGNARGNPDLDPERGYSAELGIHYSKMHQFFEYAISTALFYSQIKDWILWQYQLDEQMNQMLWYPENLKNVERKGVEISWESILQMKQWALKNRMHYQLVQAENKTSLHTNDHSQDKQLIYVPEHVLNASLSVLYRKFSMHLFYNFVDKRYTTSSNTDYLRAYHLLNFKLGRDFDLNNTKLTALFGIVNLTNQNYQVVQGKPMPRRMFNVTIQYRFLKQ